MAVAFPHVLRGATDEKPIRFGVVGCGGRGRNACRNAMAAAKNVKLVAAADLYEDRLATMREKMKDLIEVDPKYCFQGPEAYRKVIEMDLDYVILAVPPYYRPLHFAAAVEAGRHVFMEKPVAVDPVGIRKMLAAGEKATQKKLCVVAGTQRRHEAPYIETIRRIHAGEIGRIMAAQIYWDGGPLPLVDRTPGMSDDEWMHRDWFQWRWLSGDHVVEQHVHNMDIACWVLKAHPIKASAMGGRHRRRHGDQYDVFAADVTFPGEIHVHSECRQIEGCTHNVSERVIGEKGWSNCKDTFSRDGKEEKVEVKGQDSYVQEHADLIEAIRSGKYINPRFPI
jgi:predicted dehydrogenase